MTHNLWLIIRDISYDETIKSFYLKRGIVAGIYNSSMLVFIQDESDQIQETRRFIESTVASTLPWFYFIHIKLKCHLNHPSTLVPSDRPVCKPRKFVELRMFISGIWL